MNCKPGDMAIVLGNSTETGKFVTCIELVPTGVRLCATEPADGRSSYAAEEYGPLWQIDRALEWDGIWACYVPDKYLMPIRPDADGIHVSERDEVTA